MNVLVVEDDQMTWSAMQIFLSGRGDCPFWASKAVQALDWLATENIHLVLLDVDLGEGQLSGIDVLHAMVDHEEWNTIPCVMITGTPITKIRDKAKPPVEDLLLHVHTMLEKPIDRQGT